MTRGSPLGRSQPLVDPLLGRAVVWISTTERKRRDRLGTIRVVDAEVVEADARDVAGVGPHPAHAVLEEFD